MLKVYYMKCSKYPFKPCINDFYITNNFLRNSSTMLKCSRESRKLFDNFLDLKYSQMVRHSFLIRTCEGSNPSILVLHSLVA